MPIDSQNLTDLVVRKPKAKPNVSIKIKLQLEISSITLAVLLYLLIFISAFIALLPMSFPILKNMDAQKQECVVFTHY